MGHQYLRHVVPEGLWAVLVFLGFVRGSISGITAAAARSQKKGQHKQGKDEPEFSPKSRKRIFQVHKIFLEKINSFVV
jgi:hypothetical protein